MVGGENVLNSRHPARFFGEAVEAEASSELKRKREESEFLELDLFCAKTRSDIAKFDAETKVMQVNTFITCFERAEAMGVKFDDRARLQLRDMVGTLATESTIRHAEISVHDFLRSKKVNPADYDSRFGRILAKLKRTKLSEAGLPEVFQKKTIETKGQVVEANLYFEEDRDIFEKAWEIMNITPKAKSKTKAKTGRSSSSVAA